LTHTVNVRTKGYIFVILQFTIAGLIIISALLEPIYLNHTGNYTIRIIGGLLLISGLLIIVVTLINFRQLITPNPVPRDSAQLRTTGIYGYIRHPMYLSVLTALIGFTLYYNSYYTLILCFAGVIFITIKIRFEEKYLNEKFDDYKSYSLRTKKLIPFIY
jgi:protein-S-isoprenylcysteine O-methyltransferase Ste14